MTRISFVVLAAFIFLVSFMGPRPAQAQCVNTATPSCGVYEACFAKYCPCKNDADEYFITYGKKYCERFLSKTSLSDAGKTWRDKTLNCLQETIVPKLDISTNPSCNCSSMRKFAFDSHVQCYTQPGASICDLPVDDIIEIGMTVDLSTIWTSESMRQIKAVAAVCAKTATDPARKKLWSSF
ncbi:hypothetical protein [Ruegeria sp. HKCCD6119]|uniref:hypothetical protein n=1 Tax=Ruegeria sp. HKCCD6119 TaxID=2683003 RepID=UPI001493247A|nr:hypothetical protein [Ruegeria sp. HKCCD6119]NOD85922.1 hypothetical protein [Ruegeria sp. HKCCD6119]